MLQPVQSIKINSKKITAINVKPSWVITLSDEEKQQNLHDTTAKAVRDERDQLLVASDWTQVVDAPVDQIAWGVYRQALRDLPEQAGFPFDVVYPDAP